jgi:hypothetical protein
MSASATVPYKSPEASLTGCLGASVRKVKTQLEVLGILKNRSRTISFCE